MTTPTFNLIDQPWIPCIAGDGRVVELGLKDTLLQAHELQGLGGETPLVTAALYRLLLAVLYRAMAPPEDDEDWEALWRARRWDADRITDYLERWRDRFDLFHPEHPFYQWQEGKTYQKEANELIFHFASKNNATLFDHHVDETITILTPAEAIRTLPVLQAFRPAGGGGVKTTVSSSAPWSGGSVIFFGEGNTLFETLALNFIPLDWLDGLSMSDQDRPIWEANNPLAPARKIPLGITDYLTWLNLSLRFVPEVEDNRVIVRHAVISSGLKLSKDLLDPFKHYFRIQNKGLVPLKFGEYRALWRDSASLLSFNQADADVHAPRFLEWISSLLRYRIIDSSYSYRVMAIGAVSGSVDAEPRASAAKFHFYREEHLPVPTQYLQDKELVERLGKALQLAENVRETLMTSVYHLAWKYIAPKADKLNKSQRNDVKNLMAHWAAERFYWAELEPAFFHLLEILPQHPNDALDQWTETLLDTAERAFARTEAALPDNARGLRAAVRARGKLRGSLKKFRPSSSQPEVIHDAV